MELCGLYTTNSNAHSGFISVNRPLVTVQKINNFLTKTHNHKLNGIKKASYINKWLANYSASPVESKLFFVLCGPRKLGCYQIKKMNLNKKINLSYKARIIGGQQFIKPDLSIPKCKIALEYDSKQFHSDYVQIQKDKRRIDALLHDGWKVTTIVYSQLVNRQIMDQIAKDIMRHSGQDLRVRHNNFYTKQKALFYYLFDVNEY